MEELRFDDQVAIVTGAGGGLGRCYARLLADRGARVVVNDVSEAAHQVVAEIDAAGGRAVASIHAVGTQHAAGAIMADATAAFGHVDVLINNAGFVRDKSFHAMAAEQFEQVVQVHLTGAFHLTQAAYGGMRERRYGRIVNTTSAAGVYGNFGQSNYAAAKMGLVGFTRTLAVEGARYGVQANVVAPGARTAMTEALMPEGVSLDPEAVAPLVAWLCHRDCLWSGETLIAAGGRFARFVMAETRGIQCVRPTLETVAREADAIMDTGDILMPGNLGESSQARGRTVPA